MPRILGMNIVAILVASVAFFFVGFLWYGLFFTEVWLEAEGVTPSDAEDQSPIWMIGGFLITLVQVIGMGKVLQWRNVTTIPAAVGTAFILWLLFALPFVHYAYIYRPSHDVGLLLIDASHLLVGWVVSAIVLKLFK